MQTHIRVHPISFLGIYIVTVQLVLRTTKGSPCSLYSDTQTCMRCINEQMTLACPKDHKVTGFINAGYRQQSVMSTVRDNHNQECTPMEEDCISEPVSLLPKTAECMWKNSMCDFTLSSPADFPRGQHCGQRIKPHYLIASQTNCVHESKLHSLCESGQDVAVTIAKNTTIYILSPDFPKPYSQSRSFTRDACKINISTEKNYGINIDAFYIDLPSESRSKICEEDCIEMSWKDLVWGRVIKQTRCGTNKFNINIPTDEAVIEFRRLRKKSTYQGFAIKLSSYTPVVYTYDFTTTRSFENETAEYPPGEPGSSTQVLFDPTPSITKKVLIAVIIGALVVIIAIVSTVIIMMVMIVASNRKHIKDSEEMNGLELTDNNETQEIEPLNRMDLNITESYSSVFESVDGEEFNHFNDYQNTDNNYTSQDSGIFKDKLPQNNNTKLYMLGPDYRRINDSEESMDSLLFKGDNSTENQRKNTLCSCDDVLDAVNAVADTYTTHSDIVDVIRSGQRILTADFISVDGVDL